MTVRIVKQPIIRIGKFGGSFVNIHREYQPVPDAPLPEFSNKTGFGPLSAPNTRICVGGNGGVTDVRNRLFAIENGTPEPTELCRTPEGLLRFMDQFPRINDDADPFLNDNPYADFTDPKYNIQNTDFYGRGASANNQLNNVVLVSGITFRIAAVPKNINGYGIQFGQFSQSQLETDFIIKNSSASFGYDDSVASSHYYNLCDPSASVPKPVIVTDKRNAEARYKILSRNSATIPRREITVRWRYYLEIRHGLNTEKYFFVINTNPYIQDTMRVSKKTNSIILKWYTSSNSHRKSQVKKTISSEDYSGQLYDLPEFLDIMFYADPCDTNALTQEQLGVI